MVREDARYGEVVQRTLAEVAPVADKVLEPPWYEEGDTSYVEMFGATMDETRAFAVRCLQRRLKVIGLLAATT
jgi:ribonucleoside-diphosphate reductase beta chain